MAVSGTFQGSLHFIFYPVHCAYVCGHSSGVLKKIKHGAKNVASVKMIFKFYKIIFELFLFIGVARKFSKKLFVICLRLPV